MIHVYKCEICGNIEIRHENETETIYCCHEPMGEMSAKTSDFGEEKHLPLVTRTAPSTLHVRVGETLHPTTDTHRVQWIYVETENGGQRIELGDVPEVDVEVGDEKVVAVYAYCNLHGLWKTEM